MEPAQPYVCLNGTCQLSISRPGEVKDGVRERAKGPEDRRDPAANDSYQCEIYSPVLIRLLWPAPQNPTTPFL